MLLIRGGLRFVMLLSNNKPTKYMKKNISIGVLIAILLFVLLFVTITTFSNPLNCESANMIITTTSSVFALIMTSYWLYCIVETFRSKRWLYGTILLVGLLSFFYIPFYLRQGLFLEIGTSIFLLNIIFWCIYFAKYRDLSFLILIMGWSFFLLTSPYCELLWD